MSVLHPQIVREWAFVLIHPTADHVPASEPKANSPASASLLAYKRGMMILYDRDVENRAQKALDEFQQAVTLDPTSALALYGTGRRASVKGLFNAER